MNYSQHVERVQVPVTAPRFLEVQEWGATLEIAHVATIPDFELRMEHEDTRLAKLEGIMWQLQ